MYYVYLECHSVLPLVRIETPHQEPKGGGGVHTHLRVRESQFGRLEEKLSTLSILCGSVCLNFLIPFVFVMTETTG